MPPKHTNDLSTWLYWFTTSKPFTLDDHFETWFDEQFGGIAPPKHPDSQGNLTCSDEACQVTL